MKNKAIVVLKWGQMRKNAIVVENTIDDNLEEQVQEITK